MRRCLPTAVTLVCGAASGPRGAGSLSHGHFAALYYWLIASKLSAGGARLPPGAGPAGRWWRGAPAAASAQLCCTFLFPPVSRRRRRALIRLGPFTHKSGRPDGRAEGASRGASQSQLTLSHTHTLRSASFSYFTAPRWGRTGLALHSCLLNTLIHQLIMAARSRAACARCAAASARSCGGSTEAPVVPRPGKDGRRPNQMASFFFIIIYDKTFYRRRNDQIRHSSHFTPPSTPPPSIKWIIFFFFFGDVTNTRRGEQWLKEAARRNPGIQREAPIFCSPSPNPSVPPPLLSYASHIF